MIVGRACDSLFRRPVSNCTFEAGFADPTLYCSCFRVHTSIVFETVSVKVGKVKLGTRAIAFRNDSRRTPRRYKIAVRCGSETNVNTSLLEKEYLILFLFRSKEGKLHTLRHRPQFGRLCTTMALAYKLLDLRLERRFHREAEILACPV